MIFVARGIVVSLAFFAMVYCPLSLMVLLVWRSVFRVERNSILNSPNFLFGLRMFSFAASAIVALFFTFPSFWLMERASLDEDAATFVLAACSLILLTAGLARAFRAQAKTNRAVAQWLSGRIVSGDETVVPALKASNGAPALTLVGVRRPKVMVSDMATLLLSKEELRVAVRHELGHVRSCDNLKKVFMSATPFPGMRSLDDAWREAAELAADDAAVANRENALDLAAALIKLSRASKQWLEPALASGLVSGSSSINLRVERLLEWRKKSPRLRRTWPGILSFLILAGGVASNYGAILGLTHRLTEILVP